jgi:hypothetical protein
VTQLLNRRLVLTTSLAYVQIQNTAVRALDDALSGYQVRMNFSWTPSIVERQ